MGSSIIASGLPTATSWYMNPYFMATFGAVVALGFVLFALAYFVFVKLRIGQTSAATITKGESCAVCGLTSDMITRLVPCKDHTGVIARVEALEQWKISHETDYRELRQRTDGLSKRGS